jgi:hypothetical protein
MLFLLDDQLLKDSEILPPEDGDRVGFLNPLIFGAEQFSHLFFFFLPLPSSFFLSNFCFCPEELFGSLDSLHIFLDVPLQIILLSDLGRFRNAEGVN